MHGAFITDSINHSLRQIFFQTHWFIQERHYCVLSGDMMADSDFVKIFVGGTEKDKWTGQLVI